LLISRNGREAGLEGRIRATSIVPPREIGSEIRQPRFLARCRTSHQMMSTSLTQRGVMPICCRGSGWIVGYPDITPIFGFCPDGRSPRLSH
jgi:hypothetical protein